MSDHNKESSYSRSSKSYSREKNNSREYYKSENEQKSEKSVRSRRSSKSPQNNQNSNSAEQKKLIKLPIYIVIDDDYYDKLEREGFEIFDKIKSKYVLESMKIDDSIQVPELKGKIVNINSTIDDDRYDAAEYFAERYIKSSEDYKDSASGVTLKILMPENVVSLFIGAKGKHIKQLMYDTRTKLIVSQPTQTSTLRALTIQADLHYIKKSIRTIISTLERLATDKHYNNADTKPKTSGNRNGKVIAKIIIDDEVVSHLYNKRDNIIRNICKDYNVGIKVFDAPRNLNLKREEQICVS